nr:hypothetical protein [Thecaphora frezii]
MLAYGFALAAMALVLPATVTNASPTGFLSFAAQARTMSLADCHFTTAVGVAAGKKKCHKLTLGDIHVPAGQTLDLTGLRDGTHVVFAECQLVALFLARRDAHRRGKVAVGQRHGARLGGERQEAGRRGVRHRRRQDERHGGQCEAIREHRG